MARILHNADLTYLKVYLNEADEVSHRKTPSGKHLMGHLQRLRLLMLAGSARGLVLDLGSGDSPLSEMMAYRGATIICLDFVPAFIERIKNRVKSRIIHPNIHVVRGCAEALPFGQAIFDTIVMGELFEHLPNASNVLRQALESLKQNGKILISTPNKLTNPTGVGIHTHTQVYDYFSLRALLYKNGLKPKFFNYPIFPPLPAFFLKLIFRLGYQRYYKEQREDPHLLRRIFVALTQDLSSLSKFMPFLSFSLICEASPIKIRESST